MKKQIFTFTLEEKGNGVLEIDYDLAIFVYEFRVWSDFFEAFIPVSELWLKANLPVRYKRALTKLYEEAYMNRQPKPKDFDNDDGPFAA